jgi:hypothetical protein
MQLHRRRLVRPPRSSDNIPLARGISQHASCAQKQRQVGGLRPGEFSQYAPWSAVSCRRAFRNTASCSGLGASVSATFRSSFASSARRS